MRTFRSIIVPFCFARRPFSVTDGAFKQADLSTITLDLDYSWCTQTDHIHWDSSFIMNASGPFMLTRTSRADLSLRLQTFHSTSGLFMPHERTFLSHAVLCPPSARTFFVCADYNLSYPDHFHSRGPRNNYHLRPIRADLPSNKRHRRTFVQRARTLFV